MRSKIRLLLAGAFLLASCVPESNPVPTGTPLPAATPVLHAPEIRFALIGEPRDVNVWELFDETGASYADYALRFEYWPRLYHLAPPEFTFESLAADGMPSAVTQDGEFYSATVSLRKDLKWTDGAPFTAEDVAFTVNTALTFELGFDWSAYYPVEYLERAEVVDASMVKFVFKQQPNVEVWQYGALQGPIIQRAFWEPKIVEAANLLPDQTLRQALKDARLQLQNVQTRVNDLTVQANAMAVSGQDNREVLLELQNQQNNLIFSQNTLNKVQDELTGKFQSARGALYAVDDENEPTLGTWIPAGKDGDKWVNEANPDFPFIKPNFDRAVYMVFPDEVAAFTAPDNNEIDIILSPTDFSKISHPDGTQDNSLNTAFNEATSKDFVFINSSNAVLADLAFRQALYCSIERSRSFVGPRDKVFLLSGNWLNSDAVIPCGNESERLKSVEILRSAGYTWVKEPTDQESGSGLMLPDGNPFPEITMLVTEVDSLHTEATVHIEEKIRALGIPLIVKLVTTADIRYEVLSSKNYDMAILNWNLSLYPGYLCDWFGAGGQFEYGSERLQSECEALAVTSDLEAARGHIFQIQSVLMEDLPFIPLYADTRYDAYHNVRYPFENVLGGLGGLYGAPSYAMPAP
jgi:peptide/nickel transport system substrate-binding protein